MGGLFFAIGSLVFIAGIVGVIAGKLPKIRGRKIPALFILAGFILVMAAAAVPDAPPNPEDQIKAVFGVAKGDQGNGVTKVQYSSQEASIEYRIFPVGLTSYPNEIGLELASKIQKLFATNTDLEKVGFTVLLPFQDKFGNITWKPYCSFAFTRDLYNRINWDNFVKQDLLDVAQDVQYYR